MNISTSSTEQHAKVPRCPRRILRRTLATSVQVVPIINNIDELPLRLLILLFEHWHLGQTEAACLVSLGESSWASLGRDGNSLKRNLETQGLDQVSGLGVNLQLTTSVGQVQGRDLWDVLVLSLSLLFLQLEGDTSNWTLLNSLHQVGGVTSNLVSESLGLDLSDLSGQSLVGLEVQGQLWVVSLDQNLRGSLDSLSSNATLNG